MFLSPHHRHMALAGTLLVFLGVGTLAMAATTPGGSAADATSPETHPSDPRIASLIRQLGDPQFSIRQQATRELQAIGPSCKEALTQALHHPDAEVRLRAQRILVNVLEADFTARLEAFALDTESGKSYDLPCWETFRKLAGDSPAARQLFAEAVRQEPVLLETVQQDPRQAAEAISQRCDALIANTARSRANRLSYTQPRPVPTARMAALLLAVCSTDVAMNDAVGTRVSQLFHQSRMANEISDKADDQPLRRLLGAWVQRTAEGNLAFQSVWLAMRFQLKEGLAPAVGLLKRGEQQPYVRQMAILAIGKLGQREHIAVLEPLLSDAASCNPNPDEAKTPYRCEIRDVALCAIIHLHGRKPKDFGFEKIQPHPQTLFNQNSMGFESAAQRTAALARWKSWLEKQPTANGQSSPNRS